MHACMNTCMLHYTPEMHEDSTLISNLNLRLLDQELRIVKDCQLTLQALKRNDQSLHCTFHSLFAAPDCVEEQLKLRGLH